jgi:plastocyanin
VALGAAAFAAATPAGRSDDDGSGGRHIAIRDDCDPTDPAWAAVGGCTLKRGDVSFAEFAGENGFPVSLSASVIGHQAWRNDPPYLKITARTTVRVRNEGGRPHTFTRVASYGGGKVPNPALNKGLVTAPECPLSFDIAPGGSITVSGLGVGNHRFQCCIHPWMRALIKVKTRAGDDD